MNILALDLSLTGTGVCLPDGTTYTFSPKSKGMRRLQEIRIEIAHQLLAIDVVALEGYSYGSPNRAVPLGELGGVVRLFLYEQMTSVGRAVVDIQPTCRAKYATGKGNAGKDEVLQQAVLRSGHVFADNNAADAWWIHQMALAHYDPTNPLLVPMPAANRAGLDKVQWVEIGGKAA